MRPAPTPEAGPAAGVVANGGGGAKSPLLLLHGFTGTPVMWEPVLPYLRERHEVHAITMPGHHGGPALPDEGDSFIETLVGVVERQMDDLGLERAHIAGNSLGGWTALLLAGRGRALSTVAISPAGGWRTGLLVNLRTLLIFRRTQIGLALAFGPLQELAARPRGRRLIMWDTVARPERLPGPLARQWLRAAADTPARDLILRQSPRLSAPDGLPGADGPIRIAWGSRDLLLPYARFSGGWRRALPDADWVTLPGLGHVPMSDDPELVSNTILEVTTAYDAARATG